MGAFSRENLPVLGTWVTLVQGGRSGNKARRANVQKTPALVSAVSGDGAITVLYPNNFVLIHGFKGEPLKRLPDVAPEQLRPFTGTDLSLQILEKALLTAVKADAHARSSRPRLPATPQQCQPESAESSGQSKRQRSRSRSPAREEPPKSVPETPESRSPAKSPGRRLFRKSSEESQISVVPETPESKSRAGSSGEGRRLYRKSSDEKVPPIADSGASRSKTPHPSSGTESSTSKGLDEKANRKRHLALTSLVGRVLRSSSCGRLPTEELEASLLDGGFGAPEIAEGLRRLEACNKILLMDKLAFLI